MEFLSYATDLTLYLLTLLVFLIPVAYYFKRQVLLILAKIAYALVALGLMTMCLRRAWIYVATSVVLPNIGLPEAPSKTTIAISLLTLLLVVSCVCSGLLYRRLHAPVLKWIYVILCLLLWI